MLLSGEEVHRDSFCRDCNAWASAEVHCSTSSCKTSGRNITCVGIAPCVCAASASLARCIKNYRQCPGIGACESEVAILRAVGRKSLRLPMKQRPSRDLRCFDCGDTGRPLSHYWHCLDNTVYGDYSGDLPKHGSEICVENMLRVIPREPNLFPDCRRCQRCKPCLKVFLNLGKWWVTAPK